MSKYNTLLNILDELRKEAPLGYKRYYPQESDTEGLNRAMSRSYIHLFLKVKFGILEFTERENYITDDSEDGGIDGYFVDSENKKIYFIQSKFRTTQENFETKNIELDELLNMELDRVTKGEVISRNGISYNSKVLKLIENIKNIDDYAKYKEEVILLANLKDKYKEKIKPITLFPTEIFDFERCYNELVFPIVSGTFFNPKELKISININTKSSGNRIDYYVETVHKECDISVLFVPTIEIAKILYRYKNSVLKFNPRSYLELANGSVNRQIQSSITELSTNEFALYNNGITMLSDKTYYNDRIGRKNEAAIIVTNPQIINGGQTAYTLSRIYEERLKNHQDTGVFDSKEVLLKIITFNEDDSTDLDESTKLSLIESISKATNDQTAVTEADRRSNEKIQIEIQQKIFEDFGYFYERKRGEFGDGIRNKYIDRSKIIEREVFVRLCVSINGNPSLARRASSKHIFSKDFFSRAFSNSISYRKYFAGYRAFEILNEIQRNYDKEFNNKFGQTQYGYALRYGKIAVIYIVSKAIKNEKMPDQEFEKQIREGITKTLNIWLAFEDFAKAQKDNRTYFRHFKDEVTGQETIEVNFDNYYKGKTLSVDLPKFFK